MALPLDVRLAWQGAVSSSRSPSNGSCRPLMEASYQCKTAPAWRLVPIKLWRLWVPKGLKVNSALPQFANFLEMLMVNCGIKRCRWLIIPSWGTCSSPWARPETSILKSWQHDFKCNSYWSQLIVGVLVHPVIRPKQRWTVVLSYWSGTFLTVKAVWKRYCRGATKMSAGFRFHTVSLCVSEHHDASLQHFCKPSKTWPCIWLLPMKITIDRSDFTSRLSEFAGIDKAPKDGFWENELTQIDVIKVCVCVPAHFFRGHFSNLAAAHVPPGFGMGRCSTVGGCMMVYGTDI